MRKAAAALTLALLITAAAGAQVVNFAGANPGMYMYPIVDQNPISVNLPENYTTQKVRWLNVQFSVDLSKWTNWGVPIFNPDYSFSSSVTCYLDHNPVWQKTLDSAEKLNFTFTLNDLSDGLHKVTANVTTVGTHFETSPKWNLTDEPILNSSGAVFFTVDTAPPNLTILGLENKIYYSPNIELEFIVSEPSDTSYSLDGKNNVTLSQNTMLSGLAEGEHNATFYAKDAAGNMYSQTIYFTVAEPVPTAHIVAVSAASIAAITAAGLLLFRKKRRRQVEQA